VPIADDTGFLTKWQAALAQLPEER